MKNLEDVRATKYARTLLIKNGLDISMADVRVQHGVCMIRGQLKAAPRMHIPSVEGEVARLAGIIRRNAEIKEVVLECTFKETYFSDGSSTKTDHRLPK